MCDFVPHSQCVFANSIRLVAGQQHEESKCAFGLHRCLFAQARVCLHTLHIFIKFDGVSVLYSDYVPRSNPIKPNQGYTYTI